MNEVVGVGVDVAAIERFARWATRYDAGATARIFTARERDEAARDPRGEGVRLAESFAAKEAVGKALGTGLAGIEWADIELRRAPDVAIALEGSARRAADARGVGAWQLELETRAPVVLASAIAARGPIDPASLQSRCEVVAIPPVARAIERWGDRFTARVLDERERAYVAAHPHAADATAARIAVRRATRALLGTTRGVAVDAAEGRAPRLTLDAVAAERALSGGFGEAHLSISHAGGHSAALVVLEIRRRTCCSV